MAAKGWHREDVKAAVRKRGKTLAQLSLDAGLSICACGVALRRRLYPAEQAIADYIGVPAQQIWPDRYDLDGTPRHPRARSPHLTGRCRGRASQKHRAA